MSTLTEDGIKDEVQTVNTRSVSGVSIGYLVTMTYKLSDADGDPNTGGDANASVKVDNSCDVENINGGVRPDEPEIDDFPDGGVMWTESLRLPAKSLITFLMRL